jgi:hypothetical protein
MRIASITLILLAVFALPFVTESATNRQSEEHIREIIANLPESSRLRHQLEAGARGDGLHHSWMDKMREVGVKRAVFGLRFTWDGTPRNVTISRIAYYSKYDFDCSQISDVAQLARIRESGLEQELEGVAKELAANASLFPSEKHPQGVRGGGTVDLLDDEWLPHAPPVLGLLGDDDEQSTLLAHLGDEGNLKHFLTSSHPTQQELDQALLLASALYDDSCIMRPLLEAGANPNVQDRKEGTTPLINAAGSGATVNVSSLLDAGADPNVRDHAGRTALWLAEHKGNTTIVTLLKERNAKL